MEEVESAQVSFKKYDLNGNGTLVGLVLFFFGGGGGGITIG